MKNILKSLFSILVVVVVTIMVSKFALINYSQNIQFMLPFATKSIAFPFHYFVGVAYLLGVITVVVLNLISGMENNKILSAYKKEKEKLSISTDEKNSEITALQNKVKTLEMALDKALKKDNK